LILIVTEPQPLKSTAGSPPKVMKRKPSAPSIPTSDIAVSRPVASKPQPGQGMIPPPPAPSKIEVIFIFIC
jgi:hypothetical protein